MASDLKQLTCEVDHKPGQKLALPDHLVDKIGPGHWLVTIQAAGSTPTRDHSAFLNGYAPEDEGLYDDAPTKIARSASKGNFRPF